MPVVLGVGTPPHTLKGSPAVLAAECEVLKNTQVWEYSESHNLHKVEGTTIL